MSILEMVTAINATDLAFRNHPGMQLPDDKKLHYLRALSLLMNVDDDMHDDEKQFLLTLIHCFALENTSVDDFIAFAASPDPAIVKEMMEAFPESTARFSLLMDCIILVSQDEVVATREQDLLEQYRLMLHVSQKEFDMLRDLHNALKKRNWRAIRDGVVEGTLRGVARFDYAFRFYGAEDAIIKRLRALEVKRKRRT